MVDTKRVFLSAAKVADCHAGSSDEPVLEHDPTSVVSHRACTDHPHGVRSRTTQKVASHVRSRGAIHRRWSLTVIAVSVALGAAFTPGSVPARASGPASARSIGSVALSAPGGPALSATGSNIVTGGTTVAFGSRGVTAMSTSHDAGSACLQSGGPAAPPARSGHTTQALRRAGCAIPAPSFPGSSRSRPSPGSRISGVKGPLVNPPSSGNAGSASAQFSGIDCVTSSFCFAVGNYTLLNYPSQGLYEEWTVVDFWNGVIWTVVSSPNDWDNSNADWFKEVSCSSASFCVAIGAHVYCYVSNGFCVYYYLPFVATWNGSSWALMNIPSVTTNSNSFLSGVSCDSPSHCVAVGNFEDATTSSWYDVLEWNGASWVEEDPVGVGTWLLWGAECQNVTSCIAVGSYSGGDGTGEIEQENAGTWSTVSSPAASVRDVRCVTASFCMAVGYNGSDTTFTDEWNGSTWSAVSAPNPSVTDKLLAIDCASTGVCFASGDQSSSYTSGLIESWNGTSWSVSSSPSITPLGTELPAMSCVSASNCIAAGWYEYSGPSGCSDNSCLYGPLLDDWNGSSWSLQFPLTGGPITATEAPAGSPCFVCALRAVGQRYTGDPVNTEFGNLVESATDIAIPGRGVPLQFFRTYDSLGASTSGPLGHGWTFNWSTSLSQPGGSGPVTVTQENGAQTVFNPNGSSYVPVAPRDLATLIHNGDGTWTFTRLAEDTFTFSSTGQLVNEKDLNGYTTTLSYNGSGQLTTITDPANRTLTLGWTGSNITSVTDANASPARVATFQYNDGNGNLTDVIDDNGGHTHYAYSASHQLTNAYDPNCYVAGSSCDSGNGIVTHYNASGQVDWQIDQLGRQTTFAYSGDPTSAAGETATTTDPKGNVTVDIYEYGLRIQETRGFGTPQAATRQWIYDPQSGAPILMIAPNGEVTQWTVDASGNVVAAIDPLGRRTSATYNSFNEPLTEVDGNGVTTSNTYDANGNLSRISTPLTGTSQNQVTVDNYADPSHPGDVTSTVDPDNQTWSYGYDSNGDGVEAKDPLGNVTARVFNADGWVTASYTPKAGCTWGALPPTGCSSAYETVYSYIIAGTNNTDEFGDVQKVTDPLGHSASYGYDADRNRTSMTDGDGNLTTYVFDLDNEQTQVKRAGTPQTTLTTDYNPDGTVLDQKDGKSNPIQTFGYDHLARVTLTTDALSNVTTYAYDTNSNELSKQDPGGNCAATPAVSCTKMTYDADNELTGVAYSDGVTPNVTSIAYDNDGQRTGMSDGTGTSSWSWDSLHRLTGYTNGAGATVSYDYLTPTGGYDLKDQVGHITYPASVGIVTQAWDSAGRLSSVKDWNSKTTSFGYDANSNQTGTTVPSSTVVNDTFGFNAADQMSSVSVSNGVTLFSANYTRDNNNQLTSDSSVNASQGSDKYTPLNQLCYAGSSTTNACSSPPSGSYAYGFDAADNLTSDKGTTQQYNAGDELCWTLVGTSSNACGTIPSGATTYTYDTRGNRTTTSPSSKSFTCYGYDQANRLTAIVTGSTSTCTRQATTVGTYKYNGDSLRMSKTVVSTTTQFRWDGSSLAPHLLQEAGATTTSYIYGPGSVPVEQISGATTNWLHHDQLGSTRLLTSASGSSAATYTFDPYGNLASSTGTASSNLRFGAEYRDSESGLYYLQARYYDPTTGQFLERDPATAVTRSPYGYVYGNPLYYKDPSGLVPYDKVVQCYDSTGKPDGLVVQTWDTDGFFVGGETCDTLNVPGGAVWGDNGMNTGGAIVPADVNNGHYNDGPVVNAELGQKITITLCDIAAEATLAATGVGEVIEAGALITSAGFTIWDLTRR
jgi:RHS repeat-associated protein